LIARHAIGDHGQVSDEQRAANERGLQTLGRIVSRYRADPTDKNTQYILIVTEETWKETLVGLEEEVATSAVAINRRLP
jgi:hypothetical protein